eukprot:TRINITY_DN35700_c0_g1_i1.p1 TRINITY_DN35700_c0_g1~~TRINITY_DN35700_c0_g1_i1.p1  ORF type:complete len:549 (-),score=21.29 TRINITY_DN35700_c0_g1_i1:136-1782(-)
MAPLMSVMANTSTSYWGNSIHISPGDRVSTVFHPPSFTYSTDQSSSTKLTVNNKKSNRYQFINARLRCNNFLLMTASPVRGSPRTNWWKQSLDLLDRDRSERGWRRRRWADVETSYLLLDTSPSATHIHFINQKSSSRRTDLLCPASCSRTHAVALTYRDGCSGVPTSQHPPLLFNQQRIDRPGWPFSLVSEMNQNLSLPSSLHTHLSNLSCASCELISPLSPRSCSASSSLEAPVLSPELPYRHNISVPSLTPALPPLALLHSLTPSSSPPSSSPSSSPSLTQPRDPLPVEGSNHREGDTENAVPPNLDPARIPRHVAIIMDGNSRWAEGKGLRREAGHEAGVRALREVVRLAAAWGVKYLTVFAFSTENWNRSTAEVAFLMALFERTLRKEIPQLQRESIGVRFIGDVSRLPSSLRSLIRQTHTHSINQPVLTLNIAVSYSGRQDMLAACRRIAERVAAGELRPSDVSEAVVEGELETAWMGQLASPDLVIRTSGEKRLSNFLLWQAAYSELYFCDELWPEFGARQLGKAIEFYQSRERRFGHRQT